MKANKDQCLSEQCDAWKIQLSQMLLCMGAYHHPDQQLVACWHVLLGMGPQWNL